jgi:hypothetical protein
MGLGLRRGGGTRRIDATLRGGGQVSDNPCQLNRSMQHHLISSSDNTSSRETICKAVLHQNLNRAVFCLNQRP